MTTTTAKELQQRERFFERTRSQRVRKAQSLLASETAKQQRLVSVMVPCQDGDGRRYYVKTLVWRDAAA